MEEKEKKQIYDNLPQQKTEGLFIHEQADVQCVRKGLWARRVCFHHGGVNFGIHF